MVLASPSPAQEEKAAAEIEAVTLIQKQGNMVAVSIGRETQISEFLDQVATYTDLPVFELVERGNFPLAAHLESSDIAAGKHGFDELFEAGGDLYLLPAFIEPAVADDGQPQSKAGKGVGLVEFDSLVEGLSCFSGSDIDQIGKAEHTLRPGEVGFDGNGLLGGFNRPAQISKG